MTTLRIVCAKDPLIEQYFTVYGPPGDPGKRTWQEVFESELTDKALHLIRDGEDPLNWRKRLTAEARRQEWYDYTVDDQGKRHVIVESDGSKKLLVPTVEIRP